VSAVCTVCSLRLTNNRTGLFEIQCPEKRQTSVESYENFHRAFFLIFISSLLSHFLPMKCNSLISNTRIFQLSDEKKETEKKSENSSSFSINQVSMPTEVEPSDSHFLGENFGFVGPRVKDLSSQPLPDSCSVAVSKSDFLKMIILTSVWR